MGVMAVPRFHELMRTNQIHVIGRQAMIVDERMFSNALFNLSLALWLWRLLQFLTILDAPLHKNGQGRGADDPVAAHRDAIQPSPVRESGGKQHNLFKVCPAIAQAFHHPHEEFRMRMAERQTARILFVDILRQHASRFRRRILSVNAGEKHRKVSDVDGVLLLKMNFQLCFAQGVAAEVRPGPMMFSIHNAEDVLLKSPLRLKAHSCFLFRGVATISHEVHMDPITIQQPDEILNLLADISLHGKGFTTECLLDYVLDEGFTEPIYLNASGQDPDASYKGQPNAWAIYQVREWKRVLTVSGGSGKERRVQITETP